jgi:hypothetical protein
VRGALGDHRWRLGLISAVAMVALVALAAAAVMTQRGDPGASANEPQTKEPQTKEPQAKEPPASLGIDPMEGTCPKAEPEKLPPDALADATEAALDQVPSVFGHVAAYVDGEARTTEGAYASSAYLTEGGSASRPRIILDTCRKRPQYGKRLLDRSVEVNMVFPEVEGESASLSQHTVYVAKFEGDYRVYAIGH